MAFGRRATIIKPNTHFFSSFPIIIILHQVFYLLYDNQFLMTKQCLFLLITVLTLLIYVYYYKACQREISILVFVLIKLYFFEYVKYESWRSIFMCYFYYIISIKKTGRNFFFSFNYHYHFFCLRYSFCSILL